MYVAWQSNIGMWLGHRLLQYHIYLKELFYVLMVCSINYSKLISYWTTIMDQAFAAVHNGVLIMEADAKITPAAMMTSFGDDIK